MSCVSQTGDAMQHMLKCLLGAIILVAPRLAVAKDRDGAREGKGKQIEALVKRAAGSIGFSGAVLVGQGGKVLTACGAGFADEAAEQPLTSLALFEIASATKPFTAIAIGQLVSKGKLQLDDSIADHLPDIPQDCKAITIRHLLQHTSGIPGTNSRGHGDELSAVIPTFLNGGPQTPPGSKFDYWNQGYSLLSEIIARASGVAYTEYCRANIFDAAKMTSTCFTGDAPPDGAIVVVGTPTSGASRTALEHPYGNAYGFQYRGMGGIVTNVWDLWRWDRALARDLLLSSEMRAEMLNPGPGGYGLGWYVGQRDDGDAFHYHSGGVRGFVCEVRRFPDTDSCIFILCNRNDVRYSMLEQAIEQVLFDEPLKPGIPRPLTEKQLNMVAGEYVNERNQVMSIKRRGQTAVGRIDWGGPVTNGFVGMDDDRKIVFFDGSENTFLTLNRDQQAVASIRMFKSEYRRK